MMCGGVNTECQMIKNGHWEKSSIKLINFQMQHTSWKRPDGTIYLIGGQGTKNAELIRPNGTNINVFQLRHRRM